MYQLNNVVLPTKYIRTLNNTRFRHIFRKYILYSLICDTHIYIYKFIPVSDSIKADIETIYAWFSLYNIRIT